MRLFYCLIVVFLPAMLAIGCLTVSADECWVNTSGGLGGSEPIPIGAGVGATTGGDLLEPPREPLDNGAAPENPCTAESDDTKPSPPVEMGTYVRCLGLDPMTCEAMCFDIGAPCSALALNPQQPELGVGKLKQCQLSFPGSTCTYCFSNGMSCTQLKGFGVSIRWWCTYTGGKGCE